MTSQEFVLWLKGVMAASPRFQPNPEQWKTIREQIEKVTDVPQMEKKLVNFLDNRELLND